MADLRPESAAKLRHSLRETVDTLTRENARLREALTACLDVFDNMTSHDFARGADKPVREQARAALREGGAL